MDTETMISYEPLLQCKFQNTEGEAGRHGDISVSADSLIQNQ